MYFCSFRGFIGFVMIDKRCYILPRPCPKNGQFAWKFFLFGQIFRDFYIQERELYRRRKLRMELRLTNQLFQKDVLSTEQKSSIR